MTEFGYTLSSEEHSATDLVQFAQLAQAAGFRSVTISDHYHPWLESQGETHTRDRREHSLSALPLPTPSRKRPSSIVACSRGSLRDHVDRVVAAVMVDDLAGPQHPHHFDCFLQNLEAHVGGRPANPEDVFEKARIYSMPSSPPEVFVSGFGPKATSLAARVGDGYFNTSPSKDLLDQYLQQGGTGPKVALVKVCWGQDEQQCVKLAHELWRSSGIPGEASQEFAMPTHFEQASQPVSEEMVAEAISCGPDAETHARAIRKYVDAGYDEIYLNQVGPDQQGFFEFFESELGSELV